MADKETGLNIPVSAVADKNSAKEAVNELTKDVLSSLKDGYIEIPAELKVPIKGASKDLEKAQKDVITQWEKTFKKGFSSSAKDLDALTEAYQRFKKLAGQQHKAGTKQSKGISAIMGEQIQAYDTSKKAAQARRTEFKKQIEKAQKRNNTSKKSTRKARDLGPHSQEEIDANIKQENNRRYKGLKYTGPKPPRTGWVNPGATNTYQAKLSEISGYRSGFASQMRRSEKEFYKDPAHQSKTSKPDKEEFEKIWNDVTSKSKQLSEVEKAKGLSKTLTDKILPKLINDILLDRDAEGSSKQFSDTAEAIYKLSETAGINQYDTAKKEVDSVMRKFFNVTGKVGGTEGVDKTAGLNNEAVKAVIKDLFAKIEKKMDVVVDEIKTLEKTTKTSAKQKTATKDANTFANKIVSKLTASDQTQAQTARATTKAVEAVTDATEVQTNYDKIENASERIADSKENKANREAIDTAKLDASTGFNTDERALEMFAHQVTTNRLLGEIKDLLTQIFGVTGGKIKTQNSDGGNGGKRPPIGNTSDNADGAGGSYQGILLQITQHLKNIDVNVGNILQSIITQTGKIPNNLPAIIDGEGVKTHPVEKEPITDKTNYNLLHDKKVSKEVETERTAAIVHNWVQKYVKEDRKKNAQERINEEAAKKATGGVDMSEVITSTPGFFGKLQDVIRKNLSSTIEADRIMSMNKEEQMRARAQRLEMFGENRGRSLTDTGDKASVKRTKQLFGWIYKKDGSNKELLQDIQLTPGFNRESTIDTTKILGSLNKVLSGPEMFKAQTGGTLRNLIGSFTGYLGMPSIEKSRAEAEGLNQVMANVRNEVLKLLQSIQSKEMALKGMQDMGTAKFDSEGRITEDSSSIAQKTFIDLEEQKGVLRSALAEVSMIDDVVGQTGGKIHDIVKNLGFVMPELMENNTILQNINAGLDKNGKALKFQTRTGEVLNYSFQLLSRHIGQLVKNWMMMINPINLIKKAFSDFASYDVKWQRTMNVIKYNIRRIIRPFMEWLAQQLVNIIGLVNALIKGIGSAFGQNWDLFDKTAASAEKTREEMEAAANVSAGFDELHDIGSGSDPATDLSGDIYTPQWDGLNKVLEDIGNTIGNIVKAVSDWTFWDWLILAGAALAGFLALKWLLSIFSGKTNPLQTVANGFSFLEKAVGWAILIWALTEFTKALTDFVECMKTADWEDIVKSLLMLGGAFAELFLTAGGLLYLSSALSISAPSIAAIGAVVGGLALFTVALTDFIECMKSASWEDIVQSLLMLAGAFAVLVLAGGGLMFIASALGMLAPQMLALAVVIAAFAPVIWALSAFVEAIKGLTTEDMLNGLLLLAGAFMAIAVAVGVLLVVLSAAIASGVGALAILALAGILAVLSLVILSLAEFVRAIGEAGEGIKLICEGVATIITALGEQLTSYVSTIGAVIIGVIDAVANGIKTVLEPILEFIDSVIGKIFELATTIAHEIGETIRQVVKTTGDVIIGVIEALVNAIPTLLNAILRFCREIGPAIENSADAIMRTITKLINFMISGIEYLVNTLVIGSINAAISTVTFGTFNNVFSGVSIPRFVPQYEQGTNYVPNDGLAYLHEGEAVVPKKYNQPLETGLSVEEQLYMRQMISTMKSLDNTMKQGIPVSGQFVQRGSDLVAVVNKTKAQTGADLLSNVSYAR